MKVMNALIALCGAELTRASTIDTNFGGASLQNLSVLAADSTISQHTIVELVAT